MIEGKKIHAAEIKRIGAVVEVAWFFLATAVRAVDIDEIKVNARQVRNEIEKYLEHPDICE